MDKSTEKYASQKRYLKNRKQLRVWVDTEKYEAFKKTVEDNNESVYSVINRFIDNYLKTAGE